MSLATVVADTNLHEAGTTSATATAVIFIIEAHMKELTIDIQYNVFQPSCKRFILDNRSFTDICTGVIQSNFLYSEFFSRSYFPQNFTDLFFPFH
jgi:hypothetical protein